MLCVFNMVAVGWETATTPALGLYSYLHTDYINYKYAKCELKSIQVFGYIYFNFVDQNYSNCILLILFIKCVDESSHASH